VLTSKNCSPAVFLDRDGTVNVEKNYLHKIEDFEFVPGAEDAILRLNHAGYKVVIVTNQSGVARGFYGLEAVSVLHEHLQERLREVGAVVDAFYVCPHHPTADSAQFGIECDCRKGKPGMLLSAARQMHLDLSASIIVGDKLSDIEAGLAAGCTPYLVLTGFGAEESTRVPDTVKRFVDLPAVVDYIVASKKTDGVL
jgi:D-glycero-D-manno-heptose 1,7-bisphosphate phosphatase